jgi:hypothetical protein
MEQFIDKARATSPELRFAIANVPQLSKIGDLNVRIGQYNERLREAIPRWSLPSSPVELVEFMEAYSCKYCYTVLFKSNRLITDSIGDQINCSTTLDGIHPK